MRKNVILASGALVGGLLGSGVGYFSPTAVHFPPIIAIYAALFTLLGVGTAAIVWMATRTSKEREAGIQHDTPFQLQAQKALRGGPSILGGVIVMISASAWLAIGLMAGRLFVYPPALFVCGLVAFSHGLLARGSRESIDS